MDNMFLIFLATLGVGMILACLRLLYACKVEQISVCFGIFECKRDTIHERSDIQFNTSSQISNKNLASIVENKQEL